jgi:hypothetical protein
MPKYMPLELGMNLLENFTKKRYDLLDEFLSNASVEVQAEFFQAIKEMHGKYKEK